jgi:benzylsuccinate CoA-transferase BbsF subunit
LSKQKYSNKSALAGVRVLDFTTAIAGSYLTAVLALMGAEVIKVEHRSRPDLFRVDRQRPWMTTPSPQVVACWVNTLGITLDLDYPEGFELAKRLVKISQVVAENRRPGTIEKLGMSYPVLKEIKPDIIMISSSGHGGSGPERLYRGYAGIYSSLSGLSEMVGYPDSPPTDTRSSADFRAGLYGALSVLAALNHWQRTGEGQHIDFSQREANTTAVADVIMDYTMNQRNQNRNGNRDAVMAPHNCYRCRGEDRWISIAIGTDEEWQALCKVMGNPDWSKEERFCDQDRRWQNQDELDKLLEEWTINYEPFELMEILQNAGVAAIPSFTSKDLFEDRHLKERNAYSVVEHPKQGKYCVLSPPWRLSTTPPKVTKCFPMVGEDNEYVFGQLLGLSQQEMASLKEKGVI